MTCPDKLHIPYKKWALGGGVANGQQEDQNLLAIERWANRLPCSEATPRAWCKVYSGTVTESGSTPTLTAIDLSASAATHFHIAVSVTASIADHTEYGYMAATIGVVTSTGVPYNGGATGSLWVPAGNTNPDFDSSVSASWTSIDADITTVAARPTFTFDETNMPSGLAWTAYLTVIEILADESCLLYAS